MKPPRSSAAVYVLMLALSVSMLTVFALRFTPPEDAGRFAAPAVLTLLLVLAGLFTLPVRSRGRITLGTAVLFAIVLVSPPGIAMLAAGLGVLVACTTQGTPVGMSAFNAARAALQGSSAAALLQVGGWNFQELTLYSLRNILLMLGAALVLWTVGVILTTPLRALALDDDAWAADALNEPPSDWLYVAQLGIGLLAAALADAALWALPLLALPIAMWRLAPQSAEVDRSETLDDIFVSLADLADERDPYTKGHSRRVAALARELAGRLNLPAPEVDAVEWAARTHDIGKVALDLAVISKSDRLTDAEWAQIRRCPEVGAELLAKFPELHSVARYVRHCHENTDGTGYPDRLVGDSIPLGARIISVADAFDAMSSERAYRPPLLPIAILAELARHQGARWDRDVVAALIEHINDAATAPSASAIVVAQHGAVLPNSPNIAS